MAVTVHIEELVLHGFDPRHRRAIGEAIRDELARALAGRDAVDPRDERALARVIEQAMGRVAR